MRKNTLIPLNVRWLISLALGGLLTFGLVSCGLDQFRTNAAQVPRIVESILSDPKTFNSALNEESPNIFGYTYEGLIDQDGITGELKPGLAEKWEISPDKLRIKIKLREGLKWSDGEPLTADDVVFTYNEVYLNPAIPTSAKFGLMIGKSKAFPQVRKIDDLTVEFISPEPFVPLLRNTGYSILPAHALQAAIRTKDSQGNPKFLSMWGTDTDPKEIITNGMYVVERYEPTQRVIFRRNPHYWRKDSQGNTQPHIEKIVWQVVESTDTSFLQFRSGGLDTLSVSPEFYSLLKREEDRGKFTLYNGGESLNSNFISFNLNKGTRDGKPLIDPIKSRWFNTVEFRQAVAYALDRRTMVNNIYRGLGSPQYSAIASASPYYLSPEQGLKIYEYNLEKAKELLLKAGFKYDSQNQLLDAEGNRVRFTLITNAGNKIREAMAVQIKQDLARIGMQVDFNAIAFSTLVDKLGNSLDWECHLLGFGGGGVDPSASSNVWSTDGSLHAFNQQPQAGQPQIQGWKPDPWEQKIESLFIQGSQEFDEDKRKAIYGEMQQVIAENLPFIYLVTPLSVAAIRDRITGIQFTALGGAFHNLYELKITEE